MYKLVVRYFGDLCEKEKRNDFEVFDESILDIADSEDKLVNYFEETIKEFILNDYVEDNIENDLNYIKNIKCNYFRRFFSEYFENWNSYVEVSIELCRFDLKNDFDEDLLGKLVDCGDSFDLLDYGDYTGRLLAIETESGFHFQKLFNFCGLVACEKRLDEFIMSRAFESVKGSNEYFNLLKELENMFDFDIDSVDLSVNFKVV